MAGVTSGMASTFKAEILQGGHCFNATVTPTGSATISTNTITSLSSGAGIAVGMTATHASIPANAVVTSILSTTSVTISANVTSAITTSTITFGGDKFKLALFVGSPVGTYDGTQVGSQNYSGMGSDELTTSGGYTATGYPLNNWTPIVSSTQGVTQFDQASWSSATFTTSGCMIYNTNARVISTTTTGKAAAVYYFGTQTVTNGTFTVLMPTPFSANTALIQIR